MSGVMLSHCQLTQTVMIMDIEEDTATDRKITIYQGLKIYQQPDVSRKYNNGLLYEGHSSTIGT